MLFSIETTLLIVPYHICALYIIISIKKGQSEKTNVMREFATVKIENILCRVYVGSNTLGCVKYSSPRC